MKVIEIESPKATVYLPANPAKDGKAIVCCPGGGYSHLATNHEGHHWAPFYNNLGIAYVVLEYRMPKGDRTIPVSDVEATFKILKENAEAWKINPDSIGIMGSSAGGHLASTCATHPTEIMRPAFQILFYPVISLENSITHKGTRKGFLGENPTEADVKAYSNYYQVTPETPRAFLALSSDDRVVPAQNSLLYATALVENKVPVALSMFPTGGHGWGYRTSYKYHEATLEALTAWLTSF